VIRNEIRGSEVGIAQRKTTAVAVEQPPALAVPLHGVDERDTLDVLADRDQLVGAGLRGVDAVDRTAQHNGCRHDHLPVRVWGTVWSPPECCCSTTG
jgi:hypothetical protein